MTGDNSVNTDMANPNQQPDTEQHTLQDDTVMHTPPTSPHQEWMPRPSPTLTNQSVSNSDENYDTNNDDKQQPRQLHQ